MPKEQLTKQEEIRQAIADLQEAMLTDLENATKLEEVNRAKTASHYALLKAKQRLDTLNY